MRKALEVLKDSAETGEVYDRPDLVAGFDEITTLMGLPEMRELENRFLTEDTLAEKYGSA
jgi:hypothetical protein